MAKTKVVTDSAADLDPSTAREHGIAIVDLDVRLGTMGPEITRTWSPEQFWQECAKEPGLPETSAPSPGAFAQTYLDALADGFDSIVCITLSSKLSATYQAAVTGATEVAQSIPVHVVDSRSVTMGEGLLVLAAARSAAQGEGADEIAADVEHAKAAVRVYGALDTLDNLRKGGRIGSAQALLGSLLAIKPVIEVRDGVVEPESRQRTRSRSLQYLAGKVPSAEEVDELAVVHAAAGDVGSFLDLLEQRFPRGQIAVSFIGPVIGTHAGAGCVGVCFKLKPAR